MSNSTKRKASTAGLSTTGRTVKRRASKACHCCRSRKVRCDVVESGIPCTNCRLDEVECIVTEGKRRRKPYPEGEMLHQSPCLSIEEEKKQQSQLTIFDDIDGLSDLAPAFPSSTEPAQDLNALDFDLCHHRPHMLYQTQGHRLSLEERTRRMSNMSTKTLPASLALCSGPSHFPQLSNRHEVALPAYIKSVPQRMAMEDLEYLQRKGAFIIPEPGLRNELLRCYVQYVHPYLPLLDLQEFLATVQKDQPTDTVSLLLFQAVMFAATAYIDMRYLIAQGYATRKAARKAFFQRVKLLYDFDYESDRVSLVQSVLLMTYWYETPDDPKDVWHWLGVAISVARTIGLNCDTSNAPMMSLQQRRLWKRIWWCCYMRDRLVAIGMRRPMRISNGDSDVPMLELADFETDPLPAQLTRMLGGCPTVKDSTKRVALARMCIALAKLCVCISQVLAVQYSTLGHKIGVTQETTMRLVPKKCPADSCEVIRCDRDLESWFTDMPQDLHYFTPGSRVRTNAVDGEVLNVHRALLQGIYLTALSALHRPQILPSAPDVAVVPELRDLSKRKLREAANDITDMYRDLFVHDMIRFLPNTGVTCLMPAIIIHLLDLKSPDTETREASVRKFQFCMQALQRLREIYASADWAFSFLDAAVRKTNSHVSATALPVKSSSSSNSPQLDQKQGPGGQLLLTPPPEAMQTASRIVFNSTLAPEEKNLFSVFTPPGSTESDGGLRSYSMGGRDASLTNYDDPTRYEMGEKPLFSELVDADFDSVVDFQDGNDLFSSVEDGLEMNISWLDAFDGSEMNSNGGSFVLAKQEPREAENMSGYAEQNLDICGELEVDLGITAAA
ncbi:hypothetical protein PV08_00166 [Exophiala spinifera]|uniref:Zn(2)-C6 fungal-type domain-containing protein n=1 Tax=Exophiala spinifera TaxID=91928 RepID=A0A0D2BKX7_9EURO|nr:uncharacterized protein PV08_00166 [Exophiala spinifera]KIW19593.1 hypothetical protein PV08_00166 [Exophiala spinifera]